MPKQIISVESHSIYGSCGLGTYYDFEYKNREASRENYDYFSSTYRNTPYFRKNIHEVDNPGGAGWVLTSFINLPICKKAYSLLKKKYRITFQSPVRINNNSDNDFFFVIWDTTKDISVDNSNYSFPKMNRIYT